MIKKLFNMLRRQKQKEPNLQPITYGIHVFMREAGEHLRHLDERVYHLDERIRDLDRRLSEMDNGQGEAVVTAKMEFETLVEAWKSGLQTQIHRHDEMIGEVVAAMNQMIDEDKDIPNDDFG